MSATASMFSQSFFHGTKADLKPGDLIAVVTNPISPRPGSYPGFTLRGRWIRQSGALNWPPAAAGNEFISWSRPGRSRTIPT